ncbi:hypothetical protein BC937DRAFT_87724 [Endogone sp. FLAS-F59071]|nr:hypothetical protein BC937DRAFT_87724 [Endogone sp. FLAS-F59071]|eukprot:RUS19279.1 hypothetical protein BC937DRAFT_87724 [Endogone sp. FLAS-F59071]
MTKILIQMVCNGHSSSANWRLLDRLWTAAKPRLTWTRPPPSLTRKKPNLCVTASSIRSIRKMKRKTFYRSWRRQEEMSRTRNQTGLIPG